jgi:hypothetical protein
LKHVSNGRVGKSKAFIIIEKWLENAVFWQILPLRKTMGMGGEVASGSAFLVPAQIKEWDVHSYSKVS